jgi:flagellar motor switch protein FliN/FliY
MSQDSFDPTAASFPGQPVSIGGGQPGMPGMGGMTATAPMPGTQGIPQQPVTGFPPAAAAGGGVSSAMALLHGVEMQVTVELARTTMSVKDLLALAPGRVVEMDRPASALVDVLVNGTLVARGEVVVLDDEFGVRVTEIVSRDNQTPAA